MPGSPPRPPIPNGVDPVSGLWGAAGVEEEAELELPPTGPDLITKWTVIPSCEMTFGIMDGILYILILLAFQEKTSCQKLKDPSKPRGLIKITLNSETW